MAGRVRDGYGNFYVNSRPTGAHRVAYELAKGAIPPGMHVCHSCDNPPCVNPAHLWLGSARQNMQDCASKGRLPARNPLRQGARSTQAKLTDADIRVIRHDYRTRGLAQTAIAARFGVCQTRISSIVRGKSWAHVTD